MSRSQINFKELNQHLSPYLLKILTEIVSGGTQLGREYKAAGIHGGKGESFSFNLDNQKWADFAVSDHKGGDIISLYAKVKNLSQVDAAHELADQYGFSPPQDVRRELPSFIHSRYGKPHSVYIYKDIHANPTHAVVRYNLSEKNSKGKHKKQFSQWHFSETENKWIARTTPSTPLYNLDLIHRYQDKKIVICEGESSAEAAQKLLGDRLYITTCWMGGSGATAIKKTDLSPLFGRNLVLWPDNDEPGKAAMGTLASLIAQAARTINVINNKETDPETFDAGDLLESGLSGKEIATWLKERVEILKPFSTSAEVMETETLHTVATTPKSADVEILHPEHPHAPPQNVQISTRDLDSQLNPMDQARASIKWQQYGLQMKSEYKVFEHEENIYRILKQHPLLRDSFFYDEFNQCYMSTFQTTEPEPVTDDFKTKIKMLLQREFMFGSASSDAVKSALALHLKNAPKKNTQEEKIKKVNWDQVPRINDFMTDIYGVAPSEYTTAVSRIFWLQMVKRITEPGCQADIVVILEGAQGIRKTSSLRLIAGDHYAIAGRDISSKDFYIRLKGKYLVEMGELNTFSKSDHNELKEVISNNNDMYRDLFAKEATPHPRTCVFVGTTNDQYYLKDETGNRRYLPVECKKVEFEMLKDRLPQYYAEAYARLAAGEDHWEFPKEEHEKITDQRHADFKEEDPWFDAVSKYAEHVPSVFNITKFMTDPTAHFGLGMPLDRVTPKDRKRVGTILRQIGWKNGNVRDGQNVIRGWIKKNKNPEDSGVLVKKKIKNFATNEWIER